LVCAYLWPSLAQRQKQICILLLSLSALALPACSQFPAKNAKIQSAPTTVGPRKVGTVTMVNPGLKFVLLDVGSLYTPAAGSALRTFTSGIESGVINVTGERRRPFIAADIVSGQPVTGDDAFE